MQSRPNTRLHNILNQKIDYYEHAENPIPQTKWQKFAALFKHSGAKGRSRADSYHIKVNSVQTENELLNLVLNDVIGKGVGLQGSAVLRRNIYQGLCEYLHIDLNKIDSHINAVMQNAAFSLSYQNAGYIPDYDRMRDERIVAAIANAVKWPSAINQKIVKKHLTNSPLHDIINEQINFYQTVDNKKPKTTLQSIGSLFKHCGLTGRKRAATYKIDINAISSEQALLDKLLRDTLQDGYDLHGSTILKRRMLEGLCKYYQVDMAELDEEVSQNVSAIIKAYARAGVGVPVDRNSIRDEIMQARVMQLAHWQPQVSRQLR